MEDVSMKNITNWALWALLAVFLTACTNPLFERLVGVEEEPEKKVSLSLTRIGEKNVYGDDNVSFTMIYVPGGITFPTGVSDNGTATVSGAYEIGETVVTYELWYAVREWGNDFGGYTFAGNPGKEGSTGTGTNAPPTAKQLEPVTDVTWFGAAIWMNALTEWLNAKTGSSLVPVYYYDSTYAEGKVARDNTNSKYTKESSGHTSPTAWAKPGTTGFRLPASYEWELAARWRGNNTTNVVNNTTFTSTPWFTKGNSASGATAAYTDEVETKKVAWYTVNAGGKTQNVKQRLSNALGLYDMNGNVWEWCYEWFPGNAGLLRVMRGGGWSYADDRMQVGYVGNQYPTTRNEVIGLRPARTAE
jgi:formylglycine-generating enzyme required for sulfatase activity